MGGRCHRLPRLRLARWLAWGTLVNITIAISLSATFSASHPTSPWLPFGLPQTNWGTPPPVANWLFPPREHWAPHPIPESYGVTKAWYREAYALGSAPSRPGLLCEQAVFDVGFPFRCLSMRREREMPASAPRDRLLSTRMNGLKSGLVVYEMTDSSQPLIFPIWPKLGAFAAGSASYAAVVAVLGGAFRSVKRMLRNRRGRCIGCGYELNHLVVCPECGTPRGEEPVGADVARAIPDPSASP